MRTLCQHIFDLVQNSINADSTNIHVIVDEDVSNNLFKIIIKDDGCGIKPENLEKVKNTFFTTRSHKNRKVGLGLSLMDVTCKQAGGQLLIESKYRYGTTITGVMEYDNIDRPPLGDLADIFASFLLSTTENKVIWKLEHVIDVQSYCLKNRRVIDELNIISFYEVGVRDKLYQLINKKEEEIH